MTVDETLFTGNSIENIQMIQLHIKYVGEK